MTDTEKCPFCGGRTALIIGIFVYRQSSEPYKNGVKEDVLDADGSVDAYAYLCDDCKKVHGIWIE